MATDVADRAPGWRPDPLGHHQLRYWDGAGWTANVADDGVTSYEAIAVTTAARRRPPAVRRVLWSLYAAFITVILVGGALSVPARFSVLVAADSVFTVGALIALQLHVWDTRFLDARLWRAFAFGYVTWDLILNLVVSPYLDGRTMDEFTLLGLVLMLPLYAALFRYAYRTWPSEGARRVS